MSKTQNPANSNLQTALKNATDLLSHDARLAEEQVREILKVYPDTIEAKRILATAYRLQGMPKRGLDVLTPLRGPLGDSPSFLHEIAQCLGGVGRGDDAIHALRKAVSADPKFAPAWQSLGHQLAVAGDEAGSRQAFDRHFALSTRHPELVDAVKLLQQGKLGKAERIVRDLLKRFPTDVTAIRVLADLGVKMGQLRDAGLLLERCLELAPEFHMARHAYAMVLMRRQKPEAAIHEVEKLLAHAKQSQLFGAESLGAESNRRPGGGARNLRQGIAKLPQPGPRPDELRPHAENGGQTRRVHRGVQEVHPVKSRGG
jgi:predicted Zn-dependent protease